MSSNLEKALKDAIATSCSVTVQTKLIQLCQDEAITTVKQASDQQDTFFREAGVKLGELSTLREKFKIALGSLARSVHELTLDELLQAFNDGSKEAYKSLESRVSVVLVRDNKIQVDATVKLYETYLPMMGVLPKEGTTFGKDSYQVVHLSEFVAERVEIDPWDGNVLLDGFNNETKSDWSNVVSRDIRRLARFTHMSTHRPRENVFDVIQDLEHKTTIEQVRENPRWWKAVDAYRTAIKENLNLERQLDEAIYPRKDKVKSVPVDLDSPQFKMLTNSVQANTLFQSEIRSKTKYSKLNFVLWSNGWHSELKDLVRILVELFNDVSSIKRLAQDAGMLTSSISFNNSASLVMQEMVGKAISQGCLFNVLEVAITQYPVYPSLVSWIGKNCS